jgi:phosphate transport system substrate-binding protein
VNNISLTQLNVENGSYPLKRSMLFLLKGTPTGTVKDFIDFSLSPEGQSIVNNVENGSTSNNTTTQNPGIGPAGG